LTNADFFVFVKVFEKLKKAISSVQVKRSTICFLFIHLLNGPWRNM